MAIRTDEQPAAPATGGLLEADGWSIYMRDIGQVRRLTAEEELELGRRIEEGEGLPERERAIVSLRYSMSLVVIYFGTERTYRDQGLAHHNIILGQRYGPLLHDIFTLYLHMPTLTDSRLAPPGCESFYVLSPVPHLAGTVDWARQARPYRDRIMAALEQRFLPGLSRHIVTERMIDPRHFRDTLNSYRGSAFGIEPLLRQSAYFRPHNRSEDVPNLYFVGAGTHPGAGIPGVLSSAKIVAALLGAGPDTRERAAPPEPTPSRLREVQYQA